MKKTLITFLAVCCLFCKSFTQTGWLSLETETEDALFELQCLGNDSLFMFGDYGTVLKSFDGGETFTDISYPTGAAGFAGFFINENIGFASGPLGEIQRTINGGEDWNIVDNCGCLITSICFANENIGLYSGLAGTFRSIDAGETWEDTPVTPGFLANKIISNGPAQFIIISDSVVIKSEDGGINFEYITVNTLSNFPFTDMSFVDTEIGFVISADGLLFKTSDGGDMWNFVENVGHTDIEAIVFTTENNGFIVSNDTIIYKTTNGGADWIQDLITPYKITNLEYDGAFVYANGFVGVAYKNEVITSLDEHNISDQTFILYPNPATDQLFIKNPDVLTDINFSIFAIDGTCIKNEILLNGNSINTSELLPGIYLIRIEINGLSQNYYFEKL